MFGVIKKIFGTKSDRDRKKFQPIVEEINTEFEKVKKKYVCLLTKKDIK